MVSEHGDEHGEHVQEKVPVKEKIEKFKELVKQKHTIARARKESRLHPQDYKKHYNGT